MPSSAMISPDVSSGASPIRRIVRHFGWSLITEMANRGSLLAFSLLVARYVGVIEFGLFSLGLILAQYAWLLVDFGLSVSGTRFVAATQQASHRSLSGLLTIRTILATVVFLGGSLISFRAMDSIYHAAILATSLLFVFGGSLSIEWILRGQERFRPITVVNATVTPSVIVVGIVLVILLDSALVAAIIRPITALLVAVLLIRYARRAGVHVGLVLPSRGDWRQFFSSTPLAVSLTLAGIYPYIGMPVLAATASVTDVGEYGATLRIVTFFLGFNTLLATAAVPVMTHAVDVSLLSLRSVILRLASTSMILGFGVAACLTILAPSSIPLILGESYPRTAEMIQIASWVIPFSFARVAFAVALVSVQGQKEHLLSTTAGAVSSSIFCVILSLEFGPMGAAGSLVVSELLTLGAMALFLRRCLAHREAAVTV